MNEVLDDPRAVEFLLRLVCSALFHHGREALKLYKITPQQFEVMVMTYTTGQVSQVELPKKLFLAKSTVSALLDRLEKQGYIRREQSQADRRTYLITLTMKGRGVVMDVLERRGELVKRMLEALEPKLRAAFVEALQKVARFAESLEGQP